MRADLQRTGAALGALVTTVIAAVGFTRLDDILPFPVSAPTWLWWATIVAAALGLAATTLLVLDFYVAQRRILIGSDLSGLGRLERRRIGPIARAMASDQGATSLRALDQRASRLARISRETDDPESARAIKHEADRLADVVVFSLRQLTAFVMERRARHALGGWFPTMLALLAVGGMGFLLAVADYAKGQRALPAERIQRVQACVDRVPKPPSITKAERDTLVAACVATMTTTASTTTAPVTTVATTTTVASTTTPKP